MFFGGCWCAALTLLLEIITKLFVDSLIIGTMYIRLSRPTLRAGAFLISDFATLRRVNGKLYLINQFIDTKRQQLLSSTLRLYSLHRRGTPDITANPFTYNQIKVTYPEFDYIPMLMFMPQLVVHEINSDSPLMPSPAFIKAFKEKHASVVNQSVDSFSDDGRGCCDALGLTDEQRLENRAVDAYLSDRDFEVFGLVDGTDSISGMPTQLRFSYRYRQGEMEWNRAFVSCVSPDPESGSPLIDFNLFQRTIKCPGNVSFDADRGIPDIFESMT